MHFAMPQPLVFVQCLLGVFTTFKKFKNPCMLSKLVMGLPDFKKWKRVTNCTYTYLLFSLIMLFNLKLNAIMFGYGINLLIPNMLVIRTNVKYPKHLTKLNHLTHPLATMIIYPSSLGTSNFSLFQFWNKFCIKPFSPCHLAQQLVQPKETLPPMYPRRFDSTAI